MRILKLRAFVIISSFLIFSSCDSAVKNNMEVPDQEHDNKSGTTEKSNSDLEQYQEIFEDGLELVEEISDEISENRANKDSIYEATRSQKWVYQVGEFADHPEHLLATYQNLNAQDNACIFRTNDKHYFLFLMESKSEFEIIQDLQAMKDSLQTNNLSVRDLIEDCNRKQHLIQTDPIELGKRKEKVSIRCYTCDK